MNIIEVLQKEVNNIALENYGDDECLPVFNVFNISDDQLKNQRIVITCKHLGSQIGVNLYPNKNSTYGLDSLENIMRVLYNRTM